MATVFEPSLASSTSARPPLGADAPSMAHSLPSTNFGFDELRQRMSQFTQRFDEFIEKGRKRVLEERNQFRINVAETLEDQRMKKRDIEILELKQSQHDQTLAKETAETAEMHTTIALLTSQRDERLAQRDTLQREVAEVQKAITARREAQLKHRRYLDGQARYNEPELDFWENYLGLRIDGAGQSDRLRFVYSNMDERAWDREAWFELDTSDREYKVLQCRPSIDTEEVERVVDKLNETRDLGLFLKGMRELFVRNLT